jgi:hypothetical protein
MGIAISGSTIRWPNPEVADAHRLETVLDFSNGDAS